MQIHDRTRLHNRQTNSEQPRPDAYYHDERRDRSAGWRAEYAALHVDPDGHELVADGGERPDDCICWDDDSSLPCFPCARDGFNTPSDTPPEADTDIEQYPATTSADADTASAVDSDSDSDSSTSDEPEYVVVTDGGSQFTLPTPGEVAYDKDKTGMHSEEVLVLDVRPDAHAADTQFNGVDGPSVAELNPKYAAAAPVAEVATIRRVERQLGEEWSVEDVRRSDAKAKLRTNTFPVTRLSPRSGRQGSELYQQIRQRTKDVDGIGPATTESIASEFDSVGDIERAIDAFPDTTARLRFERCRKAAHADGTMEIYYALQEAVGASGGDDQ